MANQIQFRRVRQPGWDKTWRSVSQSVRPRQAPRKETARASKEDDGDDRTVKLPDPDQQKAGKPRASKSWRPGLTKRPDPASSPRTAKYSYWQRLRQLKLDSKYSCQRQQPGQAGRGRWRPWNDLEPDVRRRRWSDGREINCINKSKFAIGGIASINNYKSALQINYKLQYGNKYNQSINSNK